MNTEIISAIIFGSVVVAVLLDTVLKRRNQR